MRRFYYMCNSNSNYTVNSTYSSNLEKLLLSFHRSSCDTRFSKNTIGAAPYQTSGLVLCRGDINSSISGDCLNQSFQDVMNACPYSKEAFICYDFSLLKYSNQQFLNSIINSMPVILYNTKNVTGSRFSGWDPSNNTVKNYFNTVVNTLLSSVSDQAAFSSRRRFGTGVINITESLPVIYGLSQCTPDLSNNTCCACLQDFIGPMVEYFDGRHGGRIFGERCNLRYEIYPLFYGNPDQQIGSISGTVIPTPIASNNQPTQPPI